MTQGNDVLARPAQEASLLCACLLGGDLGVRAVDALVGLGAAAFGGGAPALIADSILAVHHDGKPVIHATVDAELQRRGFSHNGSDPLLELIRQTPPGVSQVDAIADEIRDAYQLRTLVWAGSDIAQAAMRGDRTAVTTLALALTRLPSSGRYRPPSVSEAWARLIDGHDPFAPPVWLARSDGLHLLDEHGRLLVFGPGGVSKTWFVLLIVRDVLHRNGTVAWVDLDGMGFGRLIGRCAQVGLGDAYLRDDTFGYYDRSAGVDMLSVISAIEGSPTLVVIDSTIGAAALHGIRDENDNVAFRRMIDDIADLTGRRGAHLLSLVDHTGMAAGKARGATSKIDAVDQAVELVRIPDKPIGRGRVGEISVVSRKSRNGVFPAGETIARVVFDSSTPMPAPFGHLGTSMAVTIGPPADEQATALEHAGQDRQVLDAIAAELAARSLPADAEVPLARVWERTDIHRDHRAKVRARLVNRGRITARQAGTAPNSPWMVALIIDPPEAL